MICRIGVGVLGTAAALSALPWLWYSISHFGGFAWGMFGFELLTIVAGAFAIMLAMGKYKDGWALAVTAIAGSILVAMVFGMYVDFVMAKKTDFPDLYPLAKNTLLGRGAVVGGLFLIASLSVFARSKKSIPLIIKSVLCIAPVAIVGALMHYNIGPGIWINKHLAPGTGSGALQAVLVLGMGVVFITLVSASGHLLIRAFESGRPADEH